MTLKEAKLHIIQAFQYSVVWVAELNTSGNINVNPRYNDILPSYNIVVEYQEEPFNNHIMITITSFIQNNLQSVETIKIDENGYIYYH